MERTIGVVFVMFIGILLFVSEFVFLVRDLLIIFGFDFFCLKFWIRSTSEITLQAPIPGEMFVFFGKGKNVMEWCAYREVDELLKLGK